MRSRVFLTDAARDFDAVGAVHGEIFGNILPVISTIGVFELAAPEVLVEIEADAFL